MFCKVKRLKINNISIYYKNIKNNYVCAHARTSE